MPRTISDYIDPALEALNAGFASEAARKRALESVGRAYDLVASEIRDALLADRSVADWSNLYYNVPALHNWKPRHAETYAMFAEQARTAGELLEVRNSIKAATILPAAPREEHPLKVAAYKDIVEIMARRNSQYERGLELGEIFGGLPVSVNVHIVHGHKGAVFPRCFFYLFGEFTPLQVIIAAAEEHARRSKGGAA